MPLDTDRRADLLAAKLRALVRGHTADAVTPTTFPGGAALLDVSAPARGGWVLVEHAPARALGPALLWAEKHAVGHLHVVAGPEAAGTLARRAAELAPGVPPASGPAVTVHEIDADRLRPEPAAPAPLAPEPMLAPGVAAFADAIREAGAEAVVEHGVLRGEVLGLEVARVVVDEHGPYLEVGVGKHDREAHRLLHGDVPAADALSKAVALVAAHRRPGARHHPLNRLARERWMRAMLVEQPGLVGAAHLAPVPSPVKRDDLRIPAPAPAAGVGVEGEPVLVVCSVGIDLDLVPTAADARLADGRDPAPRLVLAVPARDDHPVTRLLAGRLRRPAAVVPVDVPF